MGRGRSYGTPLVPTMKQSKSLTTGSTRPRSSYATRRVRGSRGSRFPASSGCHTTVVCVTAGSPRLDDEADADAGAEDDAGAMRTVRRFISWKAGSDGLPVSRSDPAGRPTGRLRTMPSQKRDWRHSSPQHGSFVEGISLELPFLLLCLAILLILTATLLLSPYSTLASPSLMSASSDERDPTSNLAPSAGVDGAYLSILTTEPSLSQSLRLSLSSSSTSRSCSSSLLTQSAANFIKCSTALSLSTSRP
mmetsp:Transcript_21934/g.64782  ORF Transcript_21934/g.64782 Transcript_21934/m.64782 type:complete len:249 (-) Transcript_21934:576-1322(-)